MRARHLAAAADPRGFLRAALLSVLAVLLAVSQPATALEVPYDVDITGVADDDLLEALRGNSLLIADEERPPPTTAALRRRAEEDLLRLDEVLDSFGYYAAGIIYEIDAEATPAHVVLRVDPGPQYRIAAYNVTGPSPALSDGSVRVSAEDLGVGPGAPAEAAPIVASQARLLGTFAHQGHPLARITEQNIVVDHADQSLTVNLKVDLGPSARFGDVTIEGLEAVQPEFVEARLPWQRGASYDGNLVDRARQTLRETGLFTAVTVAPGEAVDADGNLPIAVKVAEAKHRSVGAGLNWSTSDGFGAKLFWEHRNLLHGGERLYVAALGGETVNGLEASLRAPALSDPRFAYLAAANIIDENRDAYDSQSAGASLGLEYAASPTLTLAAGGSLEYADITEDGEKSEFTLVGLPLSLTRDTSDDLFDPHRGNRLTASLTPYVSLLGDSTQFVVTRLADSQYLSLTEDDRLILAGWGRIGSIFGDQNADIPATKRLYGGGGGSVRAFGYQMLGPLDSSGDPLGGRSQLELGLELRSRLTETIGGVVFVEGGNVYEDPFPDLGEKILWGAGAGLRYFTDLGPIRFDVALPINPREEDDDFQIYVSLGQAF